MTELFLIAHKVRGEAAFDVATQMECSICTGYEPANADWEHQCSECDGLGFWWIIPTSGHRAYPYFWIEMRRMHYYSPRSPREIQFDPDSYEMPKGTPDHYQSRAEPSRLAQLKAMLPPAKPIHRRF